MIVQTSPYPPLQRDIVYEWLNRLAAGVLLIVLSPLMLLIAWRIRQEDGSPILFAHYRVGRNGRLFRCLKFRTMVRNSDDVLGRLLQSDPAARAEWERDQKLANDPRITGIGKILRLSSLDELPQLINIWRGEMNFVGPRPIVVQELRRYGAWKRHYLAVKPGVTGLWQVSGRNNTTYERRVELDRHYVERRSWWMDAVIVLKTFKVVATREGAR
jgi:lipopolysaccharide/colanic/teichoic acid biosynthesis glycosyltransferase